MPFCAARCAPSDPATDRVKIDMAAIVEEAAEVEHFDMGGGRVIEQYGSKRIIVQGAESKSEAEELVTRWQRERPLSDEKRRAQEEEEERQQLALKLAEEERQEAERLRQEAERLRQEEERLRQEELRRQEEQRRQDEERARLEEEKARRQRERAEVERRRAEKEELQAFFNKHGFVDANAPKLSSTLLGSSKTYPLHVAAEQGEERIVELLLKAGANPAQKNSSKKTASELAQKKNKDGSRSDVLLLLAGPARPCSGGA